VENAKDEGEKEEQWLAVETVEAGGELLSTVHMQREQWRMQKGKWKGKWKGKGKRKNSGRRWKPRRPMVSYSPLFTCNVNSRECRRRRRRRMRRGRERVVAGGGNRRGRW
jgi:hypothetical protein